MPRKIPRPCREPLCSQTTIHKAGWCEKHKKENSGWHKTERQKGNRHRRGYGKTWQILRKQALERDNYLCQVCLSKGSYRPASAVDHITPKSHRRQRRFK
ncbi:HNH endonuclease [Zooshikella ganghwensis]|uniref:HNH endonuclease n=1 Tax=Zooshikella ganghwensis TaxID=202772 RepID=UPI00197E8CF5|nr:HNH endonuclease [Zooshikella ganghwensis]